MNYRNNVKFFLVRHNWTFSAILFAVNINLKNTWNYINKPNTPNIWYHTNSGQDRKSTFRRSHEKNGIIIDAKLVSYKCYCLVFMSKLTMSNYGRSPFLIHFNLNPNIANQRWINLLIDEMKMFFSILINLLYKTCSLCYPFKILKSADWVQ